MTFLICTRNGYENQELFNFAQQHYDDVRLINPENIFWMFGCLTNLYYQGKGLFWNDIEGCIIRSTNNPNSVLGKYVALCGKSGDPADRFITERIPKMHSELVKNFSQQNKIRSVFAFNQYTLNMHKNIIDFYPLVYKPVVGSHGEGMTLVRNESELDDIVNRHNFSSPIFLQEFLKINEEYRFITYNKKIINNAQKLVDPSKLFSGRRFVKIETLPYGLIKYVESFSKMGLVGIDACVDERGNYHILEQNRAPEFEHIDKATGFKTASLLMEAMKCTN